MLGASSGKTFKIVNYKCSNCFGGPNPIATLVNYACKGFIELTTGKISWNRLSIVWIAIVDGPARALYQ